MANVTVSLRSIVEHFESLPDPRHTRNRLHLLGDVRYFRFIREFRERRRES